MLTLLTLGALALQGPQAAPRAPYWQQQLRYDISAHMDEASGVLSGREQIRYVNHSPDTLTSFSLHLYLNAFRPGSRWADADSVERRRRFNDLKDPDYGFAHVRDVEIMGQPVTAFWPTAPDSTVVRFQLPAPLPPGDSMVVALNWDARASTVARRQGRKGRHFDFAQWYPIAAVYDRFGWEEHPLYPGGEFYGEFATYLVQLDVAADQVVAATGVPICGDPGWEHANQVPDLPIRYRRDYYPGAPRFRTEGATCVPEGGSGVEASGVRRQGEGRKDVVWYAENVHNMPFSMNPEYKYEGGVWGDVAIHVLYRPGDEQGWGHGVAVQRTAKALEWLHNFYGPFAWPQLTNLHRIDGGGTEFPMMIHNGSASQGLIVHELGHNYTMGILANNEWKEGWLDEGFTSFQTSMFFEAAQGVDEWPDGEAFITGLDLDGVGEPASLKGEDYDDFTSYNISIYTRGELFFHQLRYIVGDETLRRIMRTYYDRWKLKHVDEEAFREVAEEVSGMDLTNFFAQALHTTALVDYKLGRVTTRRQVATSPGQTGEHWESKVEVIRKSEGRMPVQVWVIGEHDTTVARVEGNALKEELTIVSPTRPKQVLLDPGVRTKDWNMLNNVWRRGWLWPVRGPKNKLYLDTYLSEPVHRDRRAFGIAPTIWYNDAGGITLGFRTRSNYFGRYDEGVGYSSWSTGWANQASRRDVKDSDFFTRMKNPTWLRSPGMSQTLDMYNVEGRFGAKLALEWQRRDHLGYGPTRRRGVSVTWLQPDDFRYLDRGYYDDVGTAEVGAWTAVTDQRGAWRLGAELAGAGGMAYNRRGLVAATGRSDLDVFYGRGSLTATARRNGRQWGLGVRFFGGVSTSGAPTSKQRQVYLAGADPLAQFTNPFLRSTGALFVRPDLFYHAPGGGNLRGFDPHLSAEGLVAVNAEVERTLRAVPQGRLFRRVRLAAFGDLGRPFGGDASTLGSARDEFLADAGVGLRIDHRIGGTDFTTRVDLPLYVSEPQVAQDGKPGNDRVGFRWQFSFQPAW